MVRIRLLAALVALATIAGPLAGACPCPSQAASSHEHDCCAQDGPALASALDCCRAAAAPAAATQTAALQVPAPGPGHHAPVVPAAVEWGGAFAAPPRVAPPPPAVLRI